MSTVLLIIQLILSIILTVLILLQRSEGGALGIGGGGGGFMSGRSATTSIVRMTAIVGTLFVVNCVALTIFFNIENQERSVLEQESETVTQTQTAPATEPVLTQQGDSVEGTTPTVEDLLGSDGSDTDAPDTAPSDEMTTPDAEPVTETPEESENSTEVPQ